AAPSTSFCRAVCSSPLPSSPPVPSTTLFRSLFDALWRMNPQGQFVPNLAATIPTVENGGISTDGLQYTIHLRRGVTWHRWIVYRSEEHTSELQSHLNLVCRLCVYKKHTCAEA